MMTTLPDGYRALVIGAGGAIGQAFVEALLADRRCGRVTPVTRDQPCAWDLQDPSSIARLADRLDSGPYHFVIDATGALTLGGRGPEKRLADLEAEGLQASFAINAAGPLLLLRHLHPRLARGEPAIWAKLSARVGSIEDNHKGGWYSYRIAKAALNQGLQTAAIELGRQRPQLVVAALQPGTVASCLSEPFVGASGAPASEAVQGLLQALNQLTPTGRAQFVDYAGQTIPW
jgi:NAD(P)-dependent dehydrogenase (short-subunit alcohol dehydrogenase family)